jgi:hypothetical protein
VQRKFFDQDFCYKYGDYRVNKNADGIAVFEEFFVLINYQPKSSKSRAGTDKISSNKTRFNFAKEASIYRKI